MVCDFDLKIFYYIFGVMNDNELKKLEFEKDKLLSGKETGKWKMPWGGAIEIDGHENIQDLLLRAYNIGKSIGINRGEEIGIIKLQNEIKTLLNL